MIDRAKRAEEAAEPCKFCNGVLPGRRGLARPTPSDRSGIRTIAKDAIDGFQWLQCPLLDGATKSEAMADTNGESAKQLTGMPRTLPSEEAIVTVVNDEPRRIQTGRE